MSSLVFSVLKEKIQKDLNESLKAGNQLKRLVLGMLITAIKNRELMKRQQLSKTVSETAELEKQSQLTDEESIEVVSSEIKKRKESVEQFRAGGREELAQKEKSEMDILLTYMPEQMPGEEVKMEIQKTITDLGASGLKDMGKVIGDVMTKLKGKTDGTTVSRLAKELLS